MNQPEQNQAVANPTGTQPALPTTPQRSKFQVKSIRDSKSNAENNATRDQTKVNTTIRDLAQTVRHLQSEVTRLSSLSAWRDESAVQRQDSFELLSIALKEVQTKSGEIEKLTRENEILRARVHQLEDTYAILSTLGPVATQERSRMPTPHPAALGEEQEPVFESSEIPNSNGKRPLTRRGSRGASLVERATRSNAPTVAQLEAHDRASINQPETSVPKGLLEGQRIDNSDTDELARSWSRLKTQDKTPQGKAAETDAKDQQTHSTTKVPLQSEPKRKLKTYKSKSLRKSFPPSTASAALLEQQAELNKIEPTETTEKSTSKTKSAAPKKRGRPPKVMKATPNPAGRATQNERKDAQKENNEELDKHDTTGDKSLDNQENQEPPYNTGADVITTPPNVEVPLAQESSKPNENDCAIEDAPSPSSNEPQRVPISQEDNHKEGNTRLRRRSMIAARDLLAQLAMRREEAEAIDN